MRLLFWLEKILPGYNLIWIVQTPVLQEIDFGIPERIKDPEESIQTPFLEISSERVYPHRQHDIGGFIVVFKTTIFRKPQHCGLFNYASPLEICGPSSQSRLWTGSGIFRFVRPSDTCSSVLYSSNSMSHQRRSKSDIFVLLGL